MSRNREDWVVDPETRVPLPPKAQPGYYPGNRALEQSSFWDDATRKVVLERVREVPPIRFFSPDERRVLEAICARILPQDDRDDEHVVPIVPQIDARLFTGRNDGYRYASMPEDAEAYRLGIRGIEAMAQVRHEQSFAELSPLNRDLILKSMHDGRPLSGAEEIWARMPAHRFFLMLVKDVVDAYYAHPFAWDEIGFGGPAYPRGYMRLEGGEPEPWESDEERYDWEPSDRSLPIEYELVAGDTHPMPGQGGTH